MTSLGHQREITNQANQNNFETLWVSLCLQRHALLMAWYRGVLRHLQWQSKFGSCGCFCPIHWSQVFSRVWRCSWSSADRQCTNYIWVINKNYQQFKKNNHIMPLTISRHGAWTCLVIKYQKGQCQETPYAGWHYSAVKSTHPWNGKASQLPVNTNTSSTSWCGRKRHYRRARKTNGK